MAKKSLIALWVLLILISVIGLLIADVNIENPPLNIEETDGSPSVYPYKLLVSTATLTDNGDGTATLLTGGGGGSSGNFIQNTLSPTTSDQKFSVQLGSATERMYMDEAKFSVKTSTPSGKPAGVLQLVKVDGMLRLYGFDQDGNRYYFSSSPEFEPAAAPVVPTGGPCTRRGASLGGILLVVTCSGT